MEGDDRSRLHQIIDELSDDELPVARHLLELLARGLASPLHQVADIVNDDDDAGNDEDDDEDVIDPLSSPATRAKLAQLTDEELLKLDALLETDHEAARQFWRERFGEELEEEPPAVDGTR